VVDRHPWRLVRLHRLAGLELLFCCHSSFLLFSVVSRESRRAQTGTGILFFGSLPMKSKTTGKRRQEGKNILLLQLGRSEVGRGLFAGHARGAA
jgi:hypothetical protein